MLNRLARSLDEVSVTGPIPPRGRRDWLLALIAAVAVVVEVVGEDELVGIGLVVGLGTASLVPFRRQRPLLLVAVALGLHVLLEVAASRSGLNGDASIGQILADAAVLYALCRWARPIQVVVGVALLAVILIGSEYLVEPGPEDISYVGTWLVLAFVALAMRYRSVALDQSDRRARLSERQSLARDVHDSVAHHVSAIAVQAQAARYVARSDPEAAVEAMARVESMASDTVDELRLLVGVLRADEPSARTTGPASMLDLQDLEGKPPVVVRGEHDLSSLPSAVAIGSYRIAQEAVTNARRHGHQVTRIEVVIRHTARRLVVEVIDDGAHQTAPGDGYGLVGMHERAAVLGGTVTAGPLPKAGWRVQVVLPLRMERSNADRPVGMIDDSEKRATR